MRINNGKKERTLYTQSAKEKTVNPKYEETKIFTLKDLMKEVGEIADVPQKKRDVKKKAANKITEYKVDDFINNEIKGNEFEEFKNLTINGLKPDNDHIKIPGSTKSKTKNTHKYNGNKTLDNSLNIKDRSYNDNKHNQSNEDNKSKSMKDFDDRNKHFDERRKAKQKRLEEEMKKTCSFKPQINKKSAIIDRHRNNSPNKVPRQENLYGLNAVLQGRKEELKEIVDMERYEKYGVEENKECTFKPKINSAKLPIDLSDKDISQRHEAWERKKKEKLQKIIEANKEKELLGCTFKPNFNK